MDIRRKENGKIDINEIDILYTMTKKYPWLSPIIDEYAELLEFCDTNDQKKLINELLDHFTFITMPELTNYVKQIVTYIQEKQCTPDNTILYSISDNSDCDSSQALLQFMKNKFPSKDGWEKKNFVNNLLNIKIHNLNFTNIFLVDDFSGSGSTAKRKMNYAKSILNKFNFTYNIEFLFIAHMKAAEAIFHQNNINYFSTLTLKKGITDYNNTSDILIKKDIMRSLEAKLLNKNKSNCFPFGYKKSESLFSIESYNIPNNVFPIFWWEETKNGFRETMFKRVK